MKKYQFLNILLIVSCTSSNSKNEKSLNVTPLIIYSVTASFPHSINSFTEGLVYHKGQLYESTGSPQGFPKTESVVGILDFSNGEILEKVKLNKNIYFGEGIAFIKKRLFQLTYKNKICFVYDDKNFKKIGQYNFSNDEGWGLTTDGNHIIMSDGTDVLSYIDPNNFQTVKKISVSENGYALQYLNELEYINGFIYANIWLKDEIVKIDPEDGNVVGKLDLTPLKNNVLQLNPNAQETNGIAYNSETKQILVTGKLWPKIYEIELKSD